MRPSRIAFLFLLFLYALRFWMKFQGLPPLVASHFGLDGQPNGWMPKDVFLIFGLLPIVIPAFLVFVAPWMTKSLPPELVNLPNKHYWFVPERKEQALAYLAAHMEWFGSALLVFLMFVYELVFKANADHTGLANEPFIVGLVLFLVFTALSTVALYRKFAIPKR